MFGTNWCQLIQWPISYWKGSLFHQGFSSVYEKKRNVISFWVTHVAQGFRSALIFLRKASRWHCSRLAQNKLLTIQANLTGLMLDGQTALSRTNIQISYNYFEFFRKAVPDQKINKIQEAAKLDCIMDKLVTKTEKF